MTETQPGYYLKYGVVPFSCQALISRVNMSSGKINNIRDPAMAPFNNILIHELWMRLT